MAVRTAVEPSIYLDLRHLLQLLATYHIKIELMATFLSKYKLLGNVQHLTEQASKQVLLQLFTIELKSCLHKDILQGHNILYSTRVRHGLACPNSILGI